MCHILIIWCIAICSCHTLQKTPDLSCLLVWRSLTVGHCFPSNFGAFQIYGLEVDSKSKAVVATRVWSWFLSLLLWSETLIRSFVNRRVPFCLGVTAATAYGILIRHKPVSPLRTFLSLDSDSELSCLCRANYFFLPSQFVRTLFKNISANYPSHTQLCYNARRLKYADL